MADGAHIRLCRRHRQYGRNCWSR
ncbi:MAG: hypothetical protein ACK4ZE_10260, partial [Sphingorhabdus sp.]